MTSDTFLGFLETKAKTIHNETWEHYHKGSKDPEWQHAKDKENLIGEIIREYENRYR